MAIATDFVGAAAERFWSGLYPFTGSRSRPAAQRSTYGIYEVEQIIDHRPADVGPEARLIEYWVKWN